LFYSPFTFPTRHSGATCLTASCSCITLNNYGQKKKMSVCGLIAHLHILACATRLHYRLYIRDNRAEYALLLSFVSSPRESCERTTYGRSSGLSPVVTPSHPPLGQWLWCTDAPCVTTFSVFQRPRKQSSDWFWGERRHKSLLLREAQSVRSCCRTRTDGDLQQRVCTGFSPVSLLALAEATYSLSHACKRTVVGIIFNSRCKGTKKNPHLQIYADFFSKNHSKMLL